MTHPEILRVGSIIALDAKDHNPHIETWTQVRSCLGLLAPLSLPRAGVERNNL
jgi:hypothetical protein